MQLILFQIFSYSFGSQRSVFSTFDQIFNWKIRRKHQKIFYECRAYESVDVRILFWVISHRSPGSSTPGLKRIYRYKLGNTLSNEYRYSQILKDQHDLLIYLHLELDVDPRRDDDASPMSSYRCMLRPTWMFMDRMIASINVHSIS